LFILRAIRVLETSLKDFIRAASFEAQDAENVFVWLLVILKLRFIDINKVAF
jgi:hypothetical protein